MTTRRQWLTRMAMLAPAGFAGSGVFLSAQENAPRSSQQLRAWRAEMNEVLRDNILRFWLQKSIDREHGGYYMHFDAAGVRKPENTKMIVTQARTVWLFSRASRNDFDGERMPSRDELLRAAQHGFRFLRDRMWDAKNGGFYWMLDAPSGTVTMPGKHLYGQAFALYALAEYYRASQDRGALGLADRLVELLERRAYDVRYGGYEEYFEQDWTKPAAGATGYMGPAGRKLMNTHLHLLEAFTTYLEAREAPLARRRLEELVQIQSSAVVRKHLGACTDKYQRDWTPITDGENGRVSYGHDIENVWLLAEANRALGRSSYPLLDLFSNLWDYALKYGYDARSGGLYYAGPPNQPATNLEISWWVQAEVLVSTLTMFEMTGEPRYLDLFEKSWNLVKAELIDRQSGEWRAQVPGPDFPNSDKATDWKAGYHNGRAMIECMKRLKRLETLA
ncbi:MAG: AGE family epimerase/isomerase [Bryobacterales bacterium]|nr:AGE family epimerase/isomerase [Bryobacterales bacterium]